FWLSLLDLDGKSDCCLCARLGGFPVFLADWTRGRLRWIRSRESLYPIIVCQAPGEFCQGCDRNAGRGLFCPLYCVLPVSYSAFDRIHALARLRGWTISQSIHPLQRHAARYDRHLISVP